jgi:hypothetical protein
LFSFTPSIERKGGAFDPALPASVFLLPFCLSPYGLAESVDKVER